MNHLLRKTTLALAAAAAMHAPAGAVEIVATWTGGGGNSKWSNAANWNVGVVPVNTGPVIFDVVIPTSGVVVDFEVPNPAAQVRSLLLGDGARLRPLTAGLTVTGAASIAGIVDANGGRFAADGAVFSGQRARVYAKGAAAVDIGASAYSSKGLVFSDSSYDANVYTSNLFTASDAGTVLNLGSLRNIDAGFGPQANDINRHEITVSTGATLNLSGVTAVTAPTSFNDWIRFSISGAGSSLLLDSLATAGGVGHGRVVFNASDAAAMQLPSLSSIKDTVFIASTRASITTTAPASYTSKGLVTGDSSYDANVYTTNLFTASGADTLLNLASLQNIDAGFGAQANDINRHEISASTGATLNLSGVTTVTAPTSFNDWIRFSISGAGSSLLLDSLATAGGVGHGRVVFNASDAAAMQLPSLSSIKDTVFIASTRASITTTAPASYTSRGLVTGDSSYDANVYTTNLFTASGADTVLNLGSLQNIDAGFGAQANDINRHEIAASTGATLNLSGVTTVTAPTSFSDWIRFSVTGAGSSLRLDSLATIGSTGSGRTRFDVADGAMLALPSLATITHADFNASGGSTINAGPLVDVANSRFAAIGGSQFNGTGTAATYTSKGLVFADSSYDANVYTTNLFTASGADTLLNLASLQNIDAGFGPQANDVNRHEIAASAGATLNLSGVTTVTAPTSFNDWIRFSISGAGSSLLLDSLATVGGVGHGRVVFNASDAAAMQLPSLSSIKGTVFIASTRASITTTAPASYTSKGLVTGDSSYDANVYTTNLFTASGAGTVLNLASLQNIDAGFGAQANDINRHEITASTGATLNLSGVTAVTAPTSFNDWVRFSISGAGSSLLLDSLATAGGVGHGRVVFNASDAAAMQLPSLSSIKDTVFIASTRASITTTAPASYTSKGLVTGDSSYDANVYTTNLFTASGADTVLNLGSLQNIDAGFGPQANDINRHEISASTGATLKLSGVKTVTTPSSSNDWIRFTASSGGKIDLSSLSTTHSTGSGQLRITASDAGLVALGDLNIGTANTSINLSGASSVTVAGSLATTGPGAATITMASADDRLDIARDFDLASAIRLNAAPGAVLRVGGDLRYTHTNESAMQLGQAVLKMDGTPADLSTGVQALEIGGLDVDTFVGLLGNDNFGFGQLVVGAAGRATGVRLFDAVDNGNRGSGGAPEALYLFGLDDGSDGLRILGGSTLYLFHLPAYARLDGQVVNLYSLFPSGVTTIAFDEGYISAVPEPSRWLLLLSGAALISLRRRRLPPAG